MTPGNVFVADTVDRGPRVIYDKNTVAAGAAVSSLVSYFGHTIAANGKHTTNLLQANRMPPPEAYAVMALGWRFTPVTLMTDYIAMINNYFWELVIGRKPIMEGLIDQYPGGVGVAGFAATNHATTALIQALNNGDPGIYAQRRFTDWPRIIPAEVNYSVDLKLGGGATAPTMVAAVASTVISPAYGGLDLRCDLDGVFDAPVQ